MLDWGYLHIFNFNDCCFLENWEWKATPLSGQCLKLKENYNNNSLMYFVFFFKKKELGELVSVGCKEVSISDYHAFRDSIEMVSELKSNWHWRKSIEDAKTSNHSNRIHLETCWHIPWEVWHTYDILFRMRMMAIITDQMEFLAIRLDSHFILS